MISFGNAEMGFLVKFKKRFPMPITKEIFCPKLSMRRYQRTILVNFQGNNTLGHVCMPKWNQNLLQ